MGSSEQLSNQLSSKNKIPVRIFTQYPVDSEWSRLRDRGMGPNPDRQYGSRCWVAPSLREASPKGNREGHGRGYYLVRWRELGWQWFWLLPLGGDGRGVGVGCPLRPSVTSPKCDDENFTCGFYGQLVGFGGDHAMGIFR